MTSETENTNTTGSATTSSIEIDLAKLLSLVGIDLPQVGSSTNPYEYNVLKTSDGYDVDISYNGKPVNNLTYSNNLSQFAVRQDINRQIQTTGILNTYTGEQLPPFDPKLLPSGSLNPLPKKIKLETVKGIVVDSITNEPLSGVKVTNSLLRRDVTNKKGEFSIKHPIIENTPLDPSKFTLSFKLRKYSPTTSIPYNSIGQLKPDLGIVTLKPTESDLKKEITNLLRFPPVIVEDYATKDVTIEFKTQKGLNKSISDLKSIVIPMILGLIAQYGISKVQEIIEKYKTDPKAAFDELRELITCPPREDIDKLIATKNKLVNKINNTLTIINKATDLLATSEKILGITSPIIKTLRQLPLPTAVAGVGIPVSVINGIRDALKFLDRLVGRLLQVNTVTLAILTLLRETLSLVLSLLTLLDLLTQFCYPDAGQSQISEELTALTQDQTQQEAPVVTNVNGFEISVETEITDKPLKRRRALAQNRNGVVMLKGEWSFSSIDQILIDELVFYIQQNNLKAD